MKVCEDSSLKRWKNLQKNSPNDLFWRAFIFAKIYPYFSQKKPIKILPIYPKNCYNLLVINRSENNELDPNAPNFIFG